LLRILLVLLRILLRILLLLLAPLLLMRQALRTHLRHLLLELGLLIGGQHVEDVVAQLARSLRIARAAGRMRLGVLIEEVLNFVVLIVGERDASEQLRPAAINPRRALGGGLLLGNGRLLSGLLGANPDG